MSFPFILVEANTSDFISRIHWEVEACYLSKNRPVPIQIKYPPPDPMFEDDILQKKNEARQAKLKAEKKPKRLSRIDDMKRQSVILSPQKIALVQNDISVAGNTHLAAKNKYTNNATNPYPEANVDIGSNSHKTDKRSFIFIIKNFKVFTKKITSKLKINLSKS
ncbi:hypothetical protein AYI69_g3930 [Smittium culicis]|uniref:Uncharacterized protein n=1 Tax=Smittium culicis TaxID=133412 RepID=A0A1R1YIC0_9FUNG|nr:hypothetical protein AYI69_g3930 [Smittium culicis]